MWTSVSSRRFKGLDPRHLVSWVAEVEFFVSLFFTPKKQNNILYIWNRISQKETSYKTSNSDAFKSFHCNQLVFDTEFQILKIYTTEIELHQVQVFTYELNILTKPLSVKVWDILP